MVAEQERGLVPAGLQPGMLPKNFAEDVLSLAIERQDDPDWLWNGATSAAAYAQKWKAYGYDTAEIKCAQMFCEVVLGQLLGPNPGDDGKGPGKSRHGDFLSKQIVNDLRRLCGHLDALIEAVRSGKRSRRSLLLLVDEIEAGNRPEPEIGDLDIRHGDFRDVLSDVGPGSVALVLTDPPYPMKYLPLWDDLGAWAAASLVEGGSLVGYCGQSVLPDVLDRLRPSLRYWWTLALLHGQSQMIPGKWVSAGWKPLVWFVRDRRATQTMLPDRLAGSGAHKHVQTGDDGSWAQGVEELAPIISALTAPGDLIVDPFAGSGTVGLAAHRYGRRFIGAESGGQRGAI